MRVISTISAMQRQVRRWRREGVRVGFVPTMGYLHDGHLGLVRRARRLVGPNGQVVVSIYVNPTQFSATEDLSKYPRDLTRDKTLCAAAGVDAIFFPDDKQMYPGRAEGDYSTYVVEERLSQGMEGAARRTHFRGVTTVVAKLLNIVQPDVAVFGAKDWQQAAVIRRMTTDLNFPLRVVVAPTQRERDGLAMSSRNVYLSSDERRQATVLRRSIQFARRAVSGKGASASRLKMQIARLISLEPTARLDYVEFFDPDTLLPMAPRRGAQMALAVFIGKTRLIDNERL